MSVSFRTIKRGKKGGFEATADSIKCLEEEIHAYEALEFRWREVQVFWFPLDRATMSNVVRGRDWRPPAADPGATDTRKLRQFLEAARPPDSIISLPNWRFAHMGLLLTAWANENGPKLFLIIDLFNNGIQVDHVLAIDFDAARKRLKDALHRRCQPDVDVFSAGIHESIDVEITELHAIVKDFEERSYNVFWFNSQHFTATVFERLTTKRLLSKLRFRWTSNHSARGGNVENLASRRDEVSDAMKVPQLKRLYLVDLDQCLFSYSPNEFGKSNKAMVVAGWASYMAGAVAVTIEGAGAGAGAAAAAAGAAGAGVAGPLLVAGGGLLFAAGHTYDKIPALCPLPRSTIWFRYMDDAWFWTPYRDGQVTGNRRWASVKTLTVPHGKFKGKTIKGTVASIAQHFAMYNPKPFKAQNVEAFECPICFDVVCREQSIARGRCGHKICTVCHGKLVREVHFKCPICRAPF